MKYSIKPEDEVKILRELIQIVGEYRDTDAVLSQIIKIVLHVTEGDSCMMFLMNEARDSLILRSLEKDLPSTIGKVRLKMGEGITGWVAKEKEIVAISGNSQLDPRFKYISSLQEEQYQAFLSVPIMLKGDMIGVINVRHYDKHQHSESEKALVSVIASQVGYVIENARLYDRTSRRDNQLKTLAGISTAIASDKYLEEMLHLIVTLTANMMESKICSVMLLDSNTNELFIEATQSLSKKYRNKPPLKVGESISGRAVENKKPVTVLDVTREEGYKYPDMARKEGIMSMLAVPMMIKDRVLGVINIYTETEHRFSAEEIEVIQSVANQAAVAIENTHLFEQTLDVREAARKTETAIMKAKKMLSKARDISEDEAYAKLVKKSENSELSLLEVAESVILNSEI